MCASIQSIIDVLTFKKKFFFLEDLVTNLAQQINLLINVNQIINSYIILFNTFINVIILTTYKDSAGFRYANFESYVIKYNYEKRIDFVKC